MKAIEYRTVDKSAWGPGPWQSEPDKAQWKDEATGLPCLIVRNPGGALCGYVGVDESHPWHGKSYSDLPDYGPDVHGGLTFSRACADTQDESKHICHLPDPGEPQHVWWFGFDCAHCDDVSPGYDSKYRSFRDSESRYRDVAYVKGQIASLARQVAAAATP